MRRYLFASALALALAVGIATTPAVAITGGQPDGNGHPYVGLLLAPGITFCSGALISETTILTAGHCPDFWDVLLTDPEAGFGGTIMVSFDAQASVDEDWQPDGGTWYEASSWQTHPQYVDEEWPFTWDYGLLFLDEAVNITPAELPSEGLIDELVPENGQTRIRSTTSAMASRARSVAVVHRAAPSPGSARSPSSATLPARVRPAASSIPRGSSSTMPPHPGTAVRVAATPGRPCWSTIRT